MYIIFLLLAIFGLQFLITQSDGPFDLINKWRNWLMLNQYVGVFFYKLFSCPYCSGAWAGLAIYLISQQSYKLSDAILWILTGGATCLIINSVLDRLHRE